MNEFVIHSIYESVYQYNKDITGNNFILSIFSCDYSNTLLCSISLVDMINLIYTRGKTFDYILCMYLYYTAICILGSPLI